MRRWVMLEDQVLAQWHLLTDPDESGRLRTDCRLTLGDDLSRLREMPDDQLTGFRCAACADKALERIQGHAGDG